MVLLVTILSAILICVKNCRMMATTFFLNTSYDVMYGKNNERITTQ